jgi:hypothetical protein
MNDEWGKKETVVRGQESEGRKLEKVLGAGGEEEGFRSHETGVRSQEGERKRQGRNDRD